MPLHLNLILSHIEFRVLRLSLVSQGSVSTDSAKHSLEMYLELRIVRSIDMETVNMGFHWSYIYKLEKYLALEKYTIKSCL